MAWASETSWCVRAALMPVIHWALTFPGAVLQAAMDAQLSSTHIGESFMRQERTRAPPGPREASADGGGPADAAGDDEGGAEGGDGSDGELPPVAVDLNLVKNLMSSVDAQHGAAGPVTGLLGGVGVSLHSHEERAGKGGT